MKQIIAVVVLLLGSASAFANSNLIALQTFHGTYKTVQLTNNPVLRASTYSYFPSIGILPILFLGITSGYPGPIFGALSIGRFNQIGSGQYYGGGPGFFGFIPVQWRNGYFSSVRGKGQFGVLYANGATETAGFRYNGRSIRSANAVVPEPSTVALMFTGLGMLAFRIKRYA